MGCFSLDWVEQLLIWFVIVCLIVAIIRLLLPKLLGLFGGPPGASVVFTIIGYILWALVAIFCIYIAFDLISCLVSSGSGPHLFPRRGG
jgi:membrane protein DedA with SNARE-associated domain